MTLSATDWHGENQTMSDSFWQQRFRADYRFVRVSRSTGHEVEEVDGITGGTITRNQDTDIYETATIDWVGSFDIGNDFLRIYLDATSLESSETRTEALGTFLVSTPSKEWDGAIRSGSADLYGRLKDAARDDFDELYVVEAGSNAVAEAAAILATCGLDVVIEDESDYTLSSIWTFGTGANGNNDDDIDNKLAAANELLELANFSSAMTDAYGVVRLKRYITPDDRACVCEFREGENARFLRTAKDEYNSFDVVNVVHADFTTTETSIRGTAVDDDPASKYSTVTTGVRNCANYSYSDLPDGETLEEQQAAADAKAKDLLITNHAVKHTLTISHIYNGATVTDGTYVFSPTWGIDRQHVIRKQTIKLIEGCLCESELRYFERSGE